MQKNFIAQLEKEAQKQAVLHENRLLPRQLDWLTTIIGNYSWQVILTLSLITAAILWSVLYWS